MAIETRYELFVSSSYSDLKAERAFIKDLIIGHGHFPVGMEEFEASQRPPWNKIERAIFNCDYYVLIIAGRYGSLEPTEKISFTEREYRLAKELNKEIIVFIQKWSSVQSLPKDKRDRGADMNLKTKKLQQFRQKLEELYVVEYRDFEDFQAKAAAKIPVWIQKYQPDNGGWVRMSELNRQICYKNVLSYLFDRINPFGDLSLTKEYLQDLQSSLSSFSEVADAVDAIIKLYVNRVITDNVRVYFAYNIARVNGHENEVEPAYRLGVSNSKEGPWNQGTIYKGPSNIHNVYRRCQVIGIPDTSHASNDEKGMNKPVKGEGSVIAAPVVYGNKTRHAIAVVGLNSRHPREALIYRPLIREMGILFSSLFYAYGQRVFTSKQKQKDEFIASMLRDQIVEHFADNYW